LSDDDSFAALREGALGNEGDAAKAASAIGELKSRLQELGVTADGVDD
jgi:hypothetical protein